MAVREIHFDPTDNSGSESTGYNLAVNKLRRLLAVELGARKSMSVALIYGGIASAVMRVGKDAEGNIHFDAEIYNQFLDWVMAEKNRTVNYA